MNKELEEALYTAKERCEGNIILDEASMNGFEEIYPFTTENIAGYIDYFDLQDKSLLTVGSSGDQIINATFKGAKDITLLDINPYAKYYYYLKTAGILELNLTDFNEFFRYNDYPKVFKYNKKVFDKASYKKLKSTLKSLDNDSYLFWDELFDMYQPDHIRFSLFSNDEYGTSVLGKSNLYLQSENTYDEAKTKLKELRSEFINEDIFKSNLTKNYDNIEKIKKLYSYELDVDEYYVPLEYMKKEMDEYDDKLMGTNDIQEVKEVVDNILNLYRSDENIKLIAIE